MLIFTCSCELNIRTHQRYAVLSCHPAWLGSLTFRLIAIWQEKAACIIIDLCSGPLAPWLPVVVAKVRLVLEVECLFGTMVSPC